MIEAQKFRREEFEQLLAEHQQLIRLANEVEYHLYQLGASGGPEAVAACQQATGTLLGLLRHVLFRHDQQVLPVLEGFVNDRGT
jgi:hypothetical protein